MTIERLSIELTRACTKGCAFCYNASGPGGSGSWTVEGVVEFARDCADHGLQALSLGGGEPMEFAGLYAILRALDGRIFRSLTTHGLHLDGELQRLVDARPDKVHVSVHFPDREAELRRVLRQVLALGAAGIPSGVNLLVSESTLLAARAAWLTLRAGGLSPGQILLLPRRGVDSPTPAQLARVAGGERFQSVTCLLACGPSPRFVSVDAAGDVGWCSYTTTRAPLLTRDHAGLLRALDGLGLRFCGGKLPLAPRAAAG